VFKQFQFGVQMTVLFANLLSYLTSAYLPPVHASQDLVGHTHSVININKLFWAVNRSFTCEKNKRVFENSTKNRIWT